MKILILGPVPPPITGHSIAVKEFADSEQNFNQVDILNLSKVEFKNGLFSLNRIFSILKLLIDLYRKKNDYDIIYFTISESIFGNIKDLLIYQICYNKLNRMIIHLHGGSFKKDVLNKSKILFSFNKFYLKKVKKIIILGESHRYIFNDFISNDKIKIVPNFANDEFFIDENLIVDKFTDKNKINVLFLSNLIYGKGYYELLNSYLNLPVGIQRHFNLNFAGSFENSNDKSKFLNIISNYDQIKYHGVVVGEKKKLLLNKSHIFCLPTLLNEGQPISIIEAYSSGCFVISTNKGGIIDILKNGENGILLDDNNSNFLSKVFIDLYDKKEYMLNISLYNHQYSKNNFTQMIYRRNMHNVLID